MLLVAKRFCACHWPCWSVVDLCVIELDYAEVAQIFAMLEFTVAKFAHHSYSSFLLWNFCVFTVFLVHVFLAYVIVAGGMGFLMHRRKTQTETVLFHPMIRFVTSV